MTDFVIPETCDYIEVIRTQQNGFLNCLIICYAKGEEVAHHTVSFISLADYEFKKAELKQIHDTIEERKIPYETFEGLIQWRSASIMKHTDCLTHGSA